MAYKMKIVTCIAPVNIAVIKYCKYLYFLMIHISYKKNIPGGKRDEELILPINDSISSTLDINQVKISNVHVITAILNSLSFRCVRELQLWLALIS